MSSDVENSRFMTRGIRANRQREFAVVFTGDRWYRMLARQERLAEVSRDFGEISELVTDVLDIRGQLRRHGF